MSQIPTFSLFRHCPPRFLGIYNHVKWHIPIFSVISTTIGRGGDLIEAEELTNQTSDAARERNSVATEESGGIENASPPKNSGGCGNVFPM